MPCCIYRDRNKVEIDPRGETGDLVTRLDCLLIARIVDKKRKREEKKRKNSVVARLINHRGQSIEISIHPLLRFYEFHERIVPTLTRTKYTAWKNRWISGKKGNEGIRVKEKCSVCASEVVYTYVCVLFVFVLCKDRVTRGSRYRVTVPRILSSGSSWCTKRSRQIIGSLGAQVKCQSL